MMRGIELKMSMKLFGIKDGVKFWFRWSFIDPIEMFVWTNLTKHPVCEYHGYHCPIEGCSHKKVYSRKEKIARLKKIERRMQKEIKAKIIDMNKRLGD